MSEKPKRSRVAILSTLLLFALVGCGIAIALQQNAKSKLSILRKENDRLAFEFDSVSQKSIADELFINEEFEAAWKAYEAIPNTDAKDLIEKRKVELSERRAERALLRENAEFLEASAEEREKLREMRLSVAEINFQNRLDSVTDDLNKDLSYLQQKLKQKEAQIAEAAKLGRLEFYNSKGTKVNYFGELENGKANGEGVGVYATGSVYDGEWKDNKKHGEGTYKWKEGEVYKGQFVEDRREGEGTYIWKNGDRYVGSWKQDSRSGFGTMYDSENKVVLEGTWKNDEFVTSTE